MRYSKCGCSITLEKDILILRVHFNLNHVSYPKKGSFPLTELSIPVWRSLSWSVITASWNIFSRQTKLRFRSFSFAPVCVALHFVRWNYRTSTILMLFHPVWKKSLGALSLSNQAPGHSLADLPLWVDRSDLLSHRCSPVYYKIIKRDGRTFRIYRSFQEMLKSVARKGRILLRWSCIDSVAWALGLDP